MSGRGVNAVDDAAKAKARETRAKNEAARANQWAADAALKQAAKTALQCVFESADATPEQILRAAELLTGLGKY